MRLSRFSLICSAILTALIVWPARALDRARDFAVDLFGRFPVLVDTRAITDLFRLRGPALAYDGPPDLAIDPALANDQKHESGLARLGTVRHL
jgi:hypothetical protein